MHKPRLDPTVAKARIAMSRALGSGIAGQLVMVGLSGGRDSLAMAAVAAYVVPRLEGRIGAVVVDHNLRAESSQVSLKAANMAADLGLDPVLIKPVTPGRSGGIEAAARKARYAAFAEVLAETGAEVVLLGHTLDDQAETVLMGLTRGSGAASISGMKTVELPFIRPFLGITRAESGRICEFYGLDYWDDPHNEDPRFLRSRIRHTIMPVLEKEIGPGISQALARTADLLRSDNEYLDSEAAQALEMCAVKDDNMVFKTMKAKPAGVLSEEHLSVSAALKLEALTECAAPVRLRVIRLLVWEKFAVSLTLYHTEQVARLISEWHGQKPVNLPRSVVAERHGGYIVFRSARKGRECQV